MRLPGGVRCIVKHIFRAEDLNLQKSIYFDDVLAYNLYEEVCRHRYVSHRSDYADALALCECIRQCSDTRHPLGKTEDFMHRVITIARQYGSRGREIGRAVAELTGSKFYDNNLITMSAQKTGISSDKLVDADEKIPNSVLYTLATGSSMFANTISPSIQPINDRLFFAQSDLIKSLAAQGPSVFVGRCADSVLEGREHVLRVFFYADFTHRVNEICKRHSLSESEAKSIIIKTDRHRANYYNYYTGRKWGKPENYDLMLATDRLTTEQAAQIVASLAGLY